MKSKTTESPIRESDIWAEMEAQLSLPEKPADAYTMDEMAARFGRSFGAVRIVVESMMAAGRLERLRCWWTAGDGTVRRGFAYRERKG